MDFQTFEPSNRLGPRISLGRCQQGFGRHRRRPRLVGFHQDLEKVDHLDSSQVQRRLAPALKSGALVTVAHQFRPPPPIKTPSSTLHKSVKKFAGKDNAQSNGLLLMTGSPIENNLTDAYGLIALLTPSRYGSYRSFERIHCLMTYGRFPQIIGYTNQDYAWESLYLKGRRVTKKEAVDLPPRLISEIQVSLADRHLELYKRLVTERVLELGDAVIDATTASSLYQKVQRMLVCPETFHDGKWTTENTLITALDELIHSLGGRKLLLFCWYTDSIRKLAMRYSHLNPATLYGEVTGKEREQMKQKFISDNSCRLMIANPRSGGVGVDQLQTVCSHVAFIEPISVPGLLEQAVSRLHRTGQQSESVNIYLFTAMKTVAVKLRNNLVAKEAAANSVVRDSKVLLAELMGEEGIVGAIEVATSYPTLQSRHDVSSYVRLTKCKVAGVGR
jgi:hypothetical protein